MRYLLLSLAFAITWLNSLATAQYPDKIIFNGKEYSLHSNPLESYFNEHPDKRPQGGILSSALWRGYVATFEIVDSQLLVKDIQIQVSDTAGKKGYNMKWKSVLNEVFTEGDNKKVDWFTGLMVLPYGELVNYVHMGYGSTFENYFLLEVDKGRFKKAKKYAHKEYEKFRERQFQAFKKTEEYEKTKASLKKDGSSDEFIDNFLRNLVTDYTSKILVD